MFDKKHINYQERIKNCSTWLKIVFKKGFDKMNNDINKIVQKNELYDKCENMEELYDKYYVPLLEFHYKKISVLEQALDENKKLINTILNFSFFKEECPLNLSFENNSKEDKAQNIFYNDEYCENNCNGIYKDCWLKYFKELQEAKGDGK